MNVNEIESEEELIRRICKANLNWRGRVSNESRYLHYDYESDILFLRFGAPGFGFLIWFDDDEQEFNWKIEDESFHIVALEIMPFRKGLMPRHPKLQVAYGRAVKEFGACDWFIDLPSQSKNGEASAVTALADILLECARDPVPVAG